MKKTITEIEIWELLNNSKKVPIDSGWLRDQYSLDLSQELRNQIAQQLAIFHEDGWEHIKYLIEKFETNEELVYASGLSCNIEAKDFLIDLVKKNPELKLAALQALSCWGATLPKKLLDELLKESSESIRIATLDLLNFKAHQISDMELIKMLKASLEDTRDKIAIKAIKIMQRYNSKNITNRLAKIVVTSSEEISKVAIEALGYIGNIYSQKKLFELLNTSENPNIKNNAKRQIDLQIKLY